MQVLFQSAPHIDEKKKDPEPDPDPYLRLMDRIREAQKHAGPADPDPVPDPQHCF